MDSWYIVRLEPGATRKAENKKFYFGPKGGRLFEKETLEISIVEMACAQSGFILRLPKTRIVYLDHKTQQPAHSTRPLIPGFAFVDAPHDFMQLESVKGIRHVLRNDGNPIQMSARDMMQLEMAERQSLKEFHHEWAYMNLQRTRLTKKEMRKEFPKGKRFRLNDGRAPGWCTIKDVTTRGTVKVIHDKLNAILDVPVDFLEVAA